MMEQNQIRGGLSLPWASRAIHTLRIGCCPPICTRPLTLVILGGSSFCAAFTTFTTSGHTGHWSGGAICGRLGSVEKQLVCVVLLGQRLLLFPVQSSTFRPPKSTIGKPRTPPSSTLRAARGVPPNPIAQTWFRETHGKPGFAMEWGTTERNTAHTWRTLACRGGCARSSGPATHVCCIGMTCRLLACLSTGIGSQA